MARNFLPCQIQKTQTMKAVCWHDAKDVRVDNVPDPQIEDDRDVVIKMTSTAICGSDLHIYNGYIPTMKSGDVLGHEFMGEVVEVGKEVKTLKKGDRIVVPFTISCGNCFFCQRDLWSLCDNSNPNPELAKKAYGHSTAALFGYSHTFGGFAGGQAEYARVPYADVGPIKIPEGLKDEQVLFLTDIFPTGYMAAENADIEPGDTVAVWGCGPVGQFAIRSAYMLGAGRVIAIDRVPERLQMAKEQGKAEVLNYEEVDILEALNEKTNGRGPDRCIDAVGMEAHGTDALAVIDKAKQALGVSTERPTALREAILACRKGGTVSIPGVYGGYGDHIPLGAIVNKALTLRSGQTHVQKYLQPLLERIQKGEIDPSYIITHRLKLEDAPRGYETFKRKQDNCIKVVLSP